MSSAAAFKNMPSLVSRVLSGNCLEGGREGTLGTRLNMPKSLAAITEFDKTIIPLAFAVYEVIAV